MSYEIIEECSENKYFTQLPNIIFHLKLSCYEISLYSALKRTVGEKQNGRRASSKGVRRLAEESGMGHTKAAETLKLLSKPRKELNGKSLIKMSQKSGKTNLITITDIMPENIIYFQKVSATRTVCPPDGQLLSATRTKEEPIKKNQDKKIDSPSFLSANKLVSLLFEKIKSIHPKHKQPNHDKWTDEMEKMLRIDERSESEIIQCIEHIYSAEDTFWAGVIKSPTSLRNNFDTIFLQMSQKKTKPVDMKAEDNKKKSEKIKSNKEIAKEYAAKYKHSPLVSVICHEFYVSVTELETRKSWNLPYSENGFKSQIESILRKIL